MSPGDSRRLVAASLWSGLGEVAAKAVPPITLLVLARLLEPEAFGILAVATGLVGFSQIFVDAGLGKALIRVKSDAHALANVVFWSNLALGVALFLVLLLAAPAIALLFHEERLVAVIRVVSLQLVLTALCSVHVALYQRNLDFRTLFWIRFATSALPNLAAIPLVWTGSGYWSLVFGYLAGYAAQAAMFWWVSPWRPRLAYDTRAAREMMRFGGWITAEGVLGWFFMWADGLIVAGLVGTAALGLYRTGNTLVSLAFGLTLAPLLPVLYSYFSQHQENRARLAQLLENVTKLFALASCALGLFVLLDRAELAAVFFDSAWQSIDVVLGAMAVLHGSSWLVGANGEAYRAIGRADLSVKIMVYALPVYALVYVFSASHGLVVFVAARALLGVAAVPVHLGVAQAVLGLGVARLLWNLRFVALAAAAGGAMWLLGRVALPQGPVAVRLVVDALLFGLGYACALLLTEQPFLKQIALVIKPKRASA